LLEKNNLQVIFTADAFQSKQITPSRSVKSTNSGVFSTSGNGGSNPNNNGYDDPDNDGNNNGMPNFPKVESVKETKKRVQNMDKSLQRLKNRLNDESETKSSSESESEENKCRMSYEEAYDLVKKNYVGSLQVTDDCKVTAWQAVKKAYHFRNTFGINLDNYPTLSKEDLVTLQKTPGGLIPYVQQGGKLPLIEYVNECQQKIYEFCHLQNTEVNRDATHYGKPCIMFYNRETREMAIFNKGDGDLITAGKYRQKYFKQCVDSGQVGKAK